MLRAILLALTAFLGLGTAWSQSVTYLSHARWRAELGDIVTAEPRALTRSSAPVAQDPVTDETTRRGIRSLEKSWHERETSVLFVRGAGTQTNYDRAPEAPVAPSSGEESQQRRTENAPPLRELRFRPEGADTWMVAADWAPRAEVLSASALRAFLEFHSETWPLNVHSRRPLVRVTRYESSKALLVVPDASGRSGSSGTAMSKTAQRAQLRPLNDPCMTAPGTSLILRLYLPEGVSLDRTGTATQLNSGETVPFPFNAEGFGSAIIPSAGPWLVEVHAVLAPDKDREFRDRRAPAPELVIHSVTLAFEAPPAPPEEKKPTSKEER